MKNIGVFLDDIGYTPALCQTHLQNPPPQWTSYPISLLIFVFMSLVGLVVLRDYDREADFLVYHLGYNFYAGKGLVYTPDDQTLLVASPLPSLIAALSPDNAKTVMTLFSAAAYALAGGSLFRLLRRGRFDTVTSGLCLALWLLSWIVWAGIRSPAGLTAMFVLGGLELATHARWRLAGLIAGLAVLAQPTGMIAAVLIGGYALTQTQGGRYWQTVWIPGAIWAGIAIAVYGIDGLAGLTLEFYPDADRQWQAIDWIIVLALGCLIIWRIKWPSLLKHLLILVAWAAGEVIGQLIFDVPQFENTALGLGVALVLVNTAHLLNRPLAQHGMLISLVGLIAVINLLTLSATAAKIEQDQHLAEYLETAESYAHDRSDALTVGLDDKSEKIYRLDGRRSSFIDAFLRSGDRESLLVALAAERLYFNSTTGPLAGIDMQSPGLLGLNYVHQLALDENAPMREGDQLWVRNSVIGEFSATQPLAIDYSADVTLLSYAIDNTRLRPGEPVRVRLDWQLARPPTSPMGVYVSLLDVNGTPVVSIFPRFEPQAWKPLELSTYHALLIPADAPPGLLNLSVTLDYKAATLAQANIGSVFLQGPVITPPETQVGTLGNAILYAANVIPAEGQIDVELAWGAQGNFDRDYVIFLHFIPVGDVVPLRQADGEPVGGRYPTHFWQAGDVIIETRTLQMTDVPAGDYEIKVGLYDPTSGGRLQGPTGDHIFLGNITIGVDGQIQIR